MPPNVPPPPPKGSGEEEIIELTDIVEKGTLGDAGDDDLFSLDDNDVDVSFEQELEELFSDDESSGDSAVDLNATMEITDPDSLVEPEPGQELMEPGEMGYEDDEEVDFAALNADTVDETSNLDFDAALQELNSVSEEPGQAVPSSVDEDQEIDLDATIAFDENFVEELANFGSDDDDEEGFDLDAALAEVQSNGVPPEVSAEPQSPVPASAPDDEIDLLSDDIDLDATMAMSGKFAEDLADELAGLGVDMHEGGDDDLELSLSSTVRADDEGTDILIDDSMEELLADDPPSPEPQVDSGSDVDIDAALAEIEQESDAELGELDQLSEQLTGLDGEDEFTLELGSDDSDQDLDIPLGDDEDLGLDLTPSQDAANDGLPQDLANQIPAMEDKSMAANIDIQSIVEDDVDSLEMTMDIAKVTQEEMSLPMDMDMDMDMDEDVLGAEDLEDHTRDQEADEELSLGADEEIDISELDELIDELDLPDSPVDFAVGGDAGGQGADAPVTQSEVESMLKERDGMEAAGPSVDLAPLLQRLEALESRLDAQQAESDAGGTGGVDVESSISQALAEGSPLFLSIVESLSVEMGKIVQEAVASLEERIVTQTELTSITQSFREDLESRIEKAVPEAAARILREEIAELKKVF
ncbi:MAG: hypothetical protein D6E12_11245 [Desulfovibrio sp.]|nr:MAG: hypothetical protein D6E12_11245 [Desulfovibrio sp.]